MCYSIQLIATLTLTLIAQAVNANTCRSTSSGNWNGSVWHSCPSSKTKYSICSGHTITLNTNVSGIDTLYVYGTLKMGSGRSITMNKGSVVIVCAGGKITGGNSNSKINFSGSSSATVTGPFTGSSVVSGPLFATPGSNGFTTFPTALATKVLRFGAKASDNSYNFVSWQILRNPYLANCVLQVSENGQSFNDIATFNEFGNDNIQNYSFNDSAKYISKQQYYRLQFTENDGSVTYSTLAVIRKQSTQEKLFSSYPNPVADVLHIVVKQSDEESEAKLSIRSISGAVLTTITDLSNNIEINVADFEKGVYFIEYESAGKVEVSKFMVR